MSGIPFTRRNDPCPCGSGLKYRACHGRIEGAQPPMEGLRTASSALDAGRLDEAIAGFDAVLAHDPGNAAALHLKGYALCGTGDFAAGLPLVERGADLEPRNAQWRTRLGAMRYLIGDIPGAIRDLQRAIALDANDADAYTNLALALRDSGALEQALEASDQALRLRPGLPAAHLNRALVLLALGRFAAAWPEYAWSPDRRVNLRDRGVTGTLSHATTLAGDGEITLHGDQGLGDVLFFMRFASGVPGGAARLRFWGDERLGPMLERSGVVSRWHPAGSAPVDLDARRLVWTGDLPHLVHAGDRKPPPVALRVEDHRLAKAAARLASLGPAPYVALTWRAGLERRGKAVLAKSIDPRALGAALAGLRGTFVSIQRNPQPGEHEALQAALGKPVADLSAVNADLEDTLATMAAVDEYVAVSNTNVHLRAGAGRASRVLVPYPPEWRWMRDVSRSPWFPDSPLYRATHEGLWDDALRQLARDLR